MPPIARRDLPDDGGVEDLPLAEEAHRPADLTRHERQRGDVEVAAVVGGQQDGAADGDVLDAGDVESRVGEAQLAYEGTEHVVRLESQHARDSWWPVPVLYGPAPGGGDDGERGIRVDGVG